MAIESRCAERVQELQKEVRQCKEANEAKAHNLVVDMAEEFSNMKAMIEVMGENIYIRQGNEFSDRLSMEVKKFKTEFSQVLRKESNVLILDSLRATEKQIMLLEGNMEDLKLSQEQMLGDFQKYQEHIDRAVHRAKEESDRKLERFAKELDKMNINGLEILKSKDETSKKDYISRKEFNDKLTLTMSKEQLER